MLHPPLLGAFLGAVVPGNPVREESAWALSSQETGSERCSNIACRQQDPNSGQLQREESVTRLCHLNKDSEGQSCS